MGTPYLGEIKIISWNFAPKGWAFCNGQFLPINQNQALFSLFGTTYGGDGRVTFALPDLRGRAPIHQGGPIGASLGEKGGEESHTVNQSEMPAHNHFSEGVSPNANSANPVNDYLASVPSFMYRGKPTNLTTLHPASVTNAGGSQPHENRQPYLVLNFIVALQGVFPSQN
jgi:microcystin-dependent protein